MSLHVLSLPLPERAVNPNARVHWGVKSKATKRMRATAQMVARAEGITRREPGTVRVHLTPIYYLGPGCRKAGYCPADDDNAGAAIKAYRDGIADALGLDDSEFEQKRTQIVRGRDAGKPQVEILVDLMDGEDA